MLAAQNHHLPIFLFLQPLSLTHKRGRVITICRMAKLHHLYLLMNMEKIFFCLGRNSNLARNVNRLRTRDHHVHNS